MDFKYNEKLFLGNHEISAEELEEKGLSPEKIRGVLESLGVDDREISQDSFGSLIRQARLFTNEVSANELEIDLINEIGFEGKFDLWRKR